MGTDRRGRASPGGNQGRASLRAWLRRRPRPAEPREIEPIWLEPCPDPLVAALPDTAPGPHARYETRESISLSFVAGLQRLPPRERAMLVLRDVLGFDAAEVADMLDTTEASVDSALEGAREAFEGQLPTQPREGAPPPDSPRERELVGRFADAFESRDLRRLTALLTVDATLTMPPAPVAYEGPEAISAFLRERSFWSPERRVRMVPTRANGQPALAYYVGHRAGGDLWAHGLLVLTLDGDRVAAVARFGESVLQRFELPPTLRDPEPVRRR